MNKKINIRNIVKDLDLDTKFYNLNNIRWAYDNPKSTSSFGRLHAYVLQFLLPLLIFVTSNYYFLENANSSHSNKMQEVLKDYKSLTIERICNNDYKELQDAIVKESNALCKKFCIFNESRKNYSKIKGVTFDDRSRSHIFAFKVRPNQLPPKNILLRVNVANVHIRCALEINIEKTKNKIVKIISIENKKKRNK